ncbi:MAG: hypothetical protein M1503_03575 [Thaumarchaeota archaeon]|nr:hypothetical protein [Nitrososphaerota archaeon]MCL5317333.1 hypothetical protein [Nitrososphaerota archaeon]
MAIIYYEKVVNGRTYPRAARYGPFTFAEQVYRDPETGKVCTRYLGIKKVPRNVIEKWQASNRNNGAASIKVVADALG